MRVVLRSPLATASAIVVLNFAWMSLGDPLLRHMGAGIFDATIYLSYADFALCVGLLLLRRWFAAATALGCAALLVWLLNGAT